MDERFVEPPAGWIPPQYRRIVQRELLEEEIFSIKDSIGYYDENGVKCNYSDAELKEKVKQIVRVEDTRLD